MRNRVEKCLLPWPWAAALDCGLGPRPWAAALGASFGFGWIPCIGPSLAGLIGIASRAPASGLALLLVYGAGMALPFVVIGWGLPAVIPKQPRLRALRIAAGFGLLIFALLIATDNMNRIGQWMLDTFPSWTSLS